MVRHGRASKPRPTCSWCAATAATPDAWNRRREPATSTGARPGRAPDVAEAWPSAASRRPFADRGPPADPYGDRAWAEARRQRRTH